MLGPSLSLGLKSVSGSAYRPVMYAKELSCLGHAPGKREILLARRGLATGVAVPENETCRPVKKSPLEDRARPDGRVRQAAAENLPLANEPIPDVEVESTHDLLVFADEA